MCMRVCVCVCVCVHGCVKPVAQIRIKRMLNIVSVLIVLSHCPLCRSVDDCVFTLSSF